MKNVIEKSINGKTEKRIRLVEEYFNKVQPDMPYKDFEAICKTPFFHMKKYTLTGKLYEFRYKYLGKFLPNPTLLVWLLKKSKKLYESGKMNQATYNLNVITTTEYISKNVELFEGFKNELKEWIEI